MHDRTIEQLKAEGLIKVWPDGTVEVDATNLTDAEISLAIDYFNALEEPADG